MNKREQPQDISTLEVQLLLLDQANKHFFSGSSPNNFFLSPGPGPKQVLNSRVLGPGTCYISTLKIIKMQWTQV